jgi:hypothetical protein
MDQGSKWSCIPNRSHFTVLHEHIVFQIYNNGQAIVIMCVSSITFSVLFGEWYITMYLPGTQLIAY